MIGDTTGGFKQYPLFPHEPASKEALINGPMPRCFWQGRTPLAGLNLFLLGVLFCAITGRR